MGLDLWQSVGAVSGGSGGVPSGYVSGLQALDCSWCHTEAFLPQRASALAGDPVRPRCDVSGRWPWKTYGAVVVGVLELLLFQL